jgi:hypothetical protein
MGLVDFMKTHLRRSKHQVHVRANKRLRQGRVARAVVHPAPSKLIKYFSKAARRGPRGY